MNFEYTKTQIPKTKRNGAGSSWAGGYWSLFLVISGFGMLL